MIPKNNNLKNLLWVLLIILTIATVASVFHPTSARQAGATLFVDPPQTNLTDATVGTTFQVNVSVKNITGLIGSQFALAWNASFINITSIQDYLYHAVTPTDFWSNINQYVLKYNRTAGTADYAFAYLDVLGAVAAGYAPINITAANYPPDGKLAVAVLNFTVASLPPPNTYVDCNFTLSNIVMGDVNADEIPTDAVNGFYRIYGPPETLNHTVVKGSTNYTVTTVSNATVVQGSMVYGPANWTVSFNLTAAPNGGTTGYVNVTIPKNFIYLANPATDQWNITVDGTQLTPIVTTDANNTYLYITTALNTNTVTIVGTVPEFPVLMIIPLLMIVTLIAVGLRRRRQI